MSERGNYPDVLEIRSDPSTMTISVGDKAFEKPYLWKVPEWSTDIKEEIVKDHAVYGMQPKERNQFYCSKLGPKFNLRFLAANYWLWLGDRYEKTTRDMFRVGGRTGWNKYNSELVAKAHKVEAYIKEAEADGLFHLIPAIVTFQGSPQMIRKDVGPATWRRIAANSRTRNMKLMQRAQYVTIGDAAPSFLSLLDYPSGVLLGVGSIDDDTGIAARLCERKTSRGFVKTWHIVRDARRMVGESFNPDWSLSRIKREHDAAAIKAATARYSAERFAQDWVYEKDGWKAELLTSQLLIGSEGATMHHCVGSYGSMSAKGNYLVFKIDGKERATLGAYPNALPDIDQVCGSYNDRVSEACMTFAYQVSNAFKVSMERAA